MLRKLAFCAVIASVAMLSGCGGKPNDPTEENYKIGINADLAKRGCLSVNLIERSQYGNGLAFPVLIDREGKDAEKARLFEAAGLVTLKPERAKQALQITKELHDVYRVELTELGKQELKNPDFRRFCVCDREVVRIVGSTEPIERFGRRLVHVTFDWKPVNVRDWTKDPKVRELPEVQANLAGGKNVEVALKQTGTGWSR